VGTVTALALYEWLVRQDLSALDIARIVAEAPDLQERFGQIDTLIDDRRIAERAYRELEAKHTDRTRLKIRLETLARVWPDLRQRLAAQLMPAREMAGLLKAAGAPANAADIGVSAAEHKAVVYASRFLRSRYTILDLLDETSLLDTAVEAVFDNHMAEAG
jgi:glycerol-1-phosphate dehydrogenase [NAD(P)+]